MTNVRSFLLRAGYSIDLNKRFRLAQRLLARSTAAARAAAALAARPEPGDDAPQHIRRRQRNDAVDDKLLNFTSHSSLPIRHWSLVIGHWSLVIGHWSLVIGHWALGIGHLIRHLNQGAAPPREFRKILGDRAPDRRVQ